MKELIILRGLPGSGKTTLANQLEEAFRLAGKSVCSVSADDFMYENGQKFDANRLSHCHSECQSCVKNAMALDTNIVIVSNTSTTQKELNVYLSMAEEFGYCIISLIVENRHGSKSIHNVPDITMDKMEERFNIKLR